MRGYVNIYQGKAASFSKTVGLGNAPQVWIYLSKEAFSMFNSLEFTLPISQNTVSIRKCDIDTNFRYTLRPKPGAWSTAIRKQYAEYVGKYYIELEEEGQDEFELIPYEK